MTINKRIGLGALLGAASAYALLWIGLFPAMESVFRVVAFVPNSILHYLAQHLLGDPELAMPLIYPVWLLCGSAVGICIATAIHLIFYESKR